MLTEKVEKLNFWKIDLKFGFISLDEKPPKNWELRRSHTHIAIGKKEFEGDTIVGLGPACVYCSHEKELAEEFRPKGLEYKRMILTEEEKEFFLKELREIVSREEDAIKTWNREVEEIDEYEYEEVEREWFDKVSVHISRREDFEEALERKESVKPLKRFVGKRCPICERPHVWKISVGSDVKVLSRRKIRETCPRCGRLGTRYVDKRGYAYFQHWEEGERQVCYIGKVPEKET